MKYEIDYTKEQLEVLQAAEGDILVSAAAGSGKTTVMVQRVIDQISAENNPLSLDKLLLTTFTENAAAQMKSEIRNKLQKLLMTDPDNQELLRQAARLPYACISTLHGFCKGLVEDFIYLLPELEAGFRIVDEAEKALLLEDSRAEVLEEYYLGAEEDREPAFSAFLNIYSGAKDDFKLEELLIKCYDDVSDYPDRDWFLKQLEVYREEPLSGPYKEKYLKLVDSLSDEVENAMDRFLGYFDDMDEEHRACLLDWIRPHREDARAAYRDYRASKDLSSYTQRLALLTKLPTFKPKPYKNQEEFFGDDELKKLFGKKREMITAAVQDVLDFAGLLLDPEKIAYCKEELYPALLGLNELLCAYRERYEKKKQARNALDFNDLEHYALRLLKENEDIRVAVRNQFERIYVDEYQDINYIQESIINLISNNNVFRVGDVKQSIYRFRNANPDSFMEKFREFPKQDGKALYVLTQNRRSTINILKTVNLFCRKLMDGKQSDILYDENHEMKWPDGAVTGEPVRFVHVEGKHEEEAAWIAEDIASRLAADCTLKASDFTILMRAPKIGAEAIRKALESRGIEVRIPAAERFYETYEIKLILSLLSVLNNPKQDIPLFAVMHSPLFEFSADELAKIRLSAAKAPEMAKCFFYEAVDYAEENADDEALREKVAAFRKKILTWREIARVLSVHDLLWELYKDSGYYVYLGGCSNGAAKRANLDMLLDTARSYENTSYSGLYDFLRYFERVKEREVDLKQAALLLDSSNAVTIMSVHASKGLGLRNIYYANLSAQKKADTDVLLMNPTEGIGAKYYVNGNKTDTAHSFYVSQILKRRADSEELCIFYVGMTRARASLCLTASDGKDGSLLNKLERLAKTEASREDFLEYLYVPKPEEDNAPIGEEKAESLGSNAEETTAVDMKQAKKLFAWSYPYMAETCLKNRYSISEVKKKTEEKKIYAEDEERETELAQVPFLPSTSDDASAAQIGIWTHSLLARGELSQMKNAQGVRAEALRLADRGILPAEAADKLNYSAITRFANSELCERVQKAEHVEKEKPFILQLSAAELGALLPEWEELKSVNPNVRIMLQGIIDCFFVENGELVLYDYKTDYKLDEERLKAYTIQLELYQRALERGLGMKVKERILVALGERKEIRV